ELADVVDEARRARARLHEADDRRADDRAVGDTPHRRHLPGRADPEADAHRHRRHAPDRADLGRHVGRQLLALAGHAGERHDVDEAAALLRDEAPAASARVPARWTTGPSASGSENGTPSSTTSAPRWAASTTSRRVSASEGSPAVK